jgi:hypothetical protein
MHKKYINVYLVDIRVQRFYEWLQHLVLDTLTKYIFRFLEAVSSAFDSKVFKKC